MKSEYGVDTILEPLAGYNTARWAEGGWDTIDTATVRWERELSKGIYCPFYFKQWLALCKTRVRMLLK